MALTLGARSNRGLVSVPVGRRKKDAGGSAGIRLLGFGDTLAGMDEKKSALSPSCQLYVENGDVVGICVSGGLDSKTVALRLRLAGVKVKCFTADIGQPDEEDVNDVVKKMAPCGVETIVVDLKDEIAEGAFEAVAAQAMYDGGYWQSTGIGRYVTARGLLAEMKKHGCTVLSHGATGRGNDQVRFERYVNVIDPSFKVYAPWRDPVLLEEFPGRSQMLTFLQKHGIDHKIVSQASKRYSTDANICGLSNEAEDLESMQTPITIVNPVMGVWPKDAPDKQEEITLKFEKGRCTQINGKAVTPLQAVQQANTIAGRNGIGLCQALENRILGTKSRGVYEAPGMALLGHAVTCVYMAVLDRRSTLLFRQLSAHISDQIYDGRYFDPSTRTAINAVWQLAEPASGTVKLGLHKGHMNFLALTDCAQSIYFEEDSSMEASAGLNPASSQGYLEVSSVEAKALAKAGLIDTGSVWAKRQKK
ncbi:argG [Symbiodinium sp. CCMP2456]|nr:argG [Symbiodinium sp. CCMP2456]